MKMFTSLTAVAVLMAGMSFASFANAQTSPSNSNNKGAMGAASGTLAPGPQAATANGKFCSETTTGGIINCTFATLADCKKVAKPNDEVCAANSKLGTTGSK